MIVVDASVVLKLLILEPGSEAAVLRLMDEADRIAPDFCLLEISNALSKKVRYAGLERARATAALAQMPRIVTGTFDTPALIDGAFDLSISIGHAIYDCFYLALALEQDCLLLTADRKFAVAAHQAGYDRVETLTF